MLGAEAGWRPGGFEYTPALPLPSPIGGAPLPLSLPGRAEVISFLRAAVRASGGPPDGGIDEVQPGSVAGAAFAAAGANATDSGVRRRQAPERYDPRPSAPTPGPKLRTPPAGYDAPFTRFSFGGGAPSSGGFSLPYGFAPGQQLQPYGQHSGMVMATPPPFHAFAAPAERVDAAELAAKVGPTASRWALQTPTAAQVMQFKAWAAELERGVLPPSAAPPEASAAAIISDPDAPPAPVSEARALEVLNMLERSEISLELLEASQIGRSVAILRTQQASAAVSAAADRIARSWRATADAIICAVGSPLAVGGATPA